MESVYYLSLSEAKFGWMGLALQAMVRTSTLHILPGIIIMLWIFVLLRRHWHRSIVGYQDVVAYVLASTVILCLFWPEATKFLQVGTVREATQVASYAASQDPDAHMVTAAETEGVPQPLRGPVLVPPGYDFLLRWSTEIPLALARGMNPKAHRTFAMILPMQWLLGLDLTADITSTVSDWVEHCYRYAVAQTMEGQSARTAEEFLPWGNTPVRQALATREVIPGAQTGLNWIQPPGAPATVRCDIYLDAIESRTQARLFELTSPKGTPLLQVFQDELGLDPLVQAQFLLYREMLPVIESLAPAPSLSAAYAKLRGLSVAGDALAGGATGAARGWLGSMGAGTGALLGFLTGGLRAVGVQLQLVIQGLSLLVGAAAFLTWYGPMALGILQLLFNMLFPLIVLWALIPGNQLAPLLHFFAALVFLNFAPLWWGIIDLVARIMATQTVPTGLEGWDAQVANWLTQGIWAASVTALGILLIGSATGWLLFANMRSIGQSWRGGLS